MRSLAYTGGSFQGIPTMRQPILWLSCCLAAILLAGCGNKGPLYMPPPAPAKPAAPAKPKPAPAPASTATAPASQH